MPGTPEYWRDGHPQRVCPRWPGRGLAWEMGTRAWLALQREEPGTWPVVLDEAERLLEESG